MITIVYKNLSIYQNVIWKSGKKLFGLIKAVYLNMN